MDEKLLSVCIITKNEKENLEKCIAALERYPFEIVVADTGSTDGTVEFLEKMQDRVRLLHFAWCDDFAAAKNFAVESASCPYVMVIDSDEFLEKIDIGALCRKIGEHPNEVGRILRKNVFERGGLMQQNTEWINRIFPKERFFYEGRIHEQVTAKDKSQYDTYQAPVEILHTGYNLPEEKRRQKAERNLRLLEAELERCAEEFLAENGAVISEENCKRSLQAERPVTTDTEQAGERPAVRQVIEILQEPSTLADALRHEGQMPYLFYQLGKSCYMAGDYAAAAEYFSNGLSFDLDPKLEYVIDMVETYGYALLNSGQAGQALLLSNVYDAFGGTADFEFLMGLIYMNNARFDDAVREFLKAAGQKTCRMAGVNSYAAYYNIGVIYECTGNIALAKKYYRRSGAYAPAEKRLKELSE